MGSPLTAPRISWGWFEHMLVTRWPNTRKVRSLDAFYEQNKASAPKDDLGIPTVTMSYSPEPKVSSARPSRKSITKANAAARKNGR